MKIYGLYDTQENDQCIRVGSLGEIIKFMNIPARAVQRALNGTRIKNRYDLMFLYVEPTIKNFKTL